MKKFKELNMNEQHREKGRFRPIIPRNVQSVATATPRKESDSANVKLKEEAGDSVNMDAPVGSQHREGDTPAGRTYREKPQKEPMHKYKEIKEQLNVRTPSVEEIAKKHGVSKEEIETQLKSGMEVEKEHTTNQKDAREIALDHLNEKPDYYKKLKKFVEHTQLDEGRPSQRHPLEGHDYHRKTDAELIHIAKDAHAAAEAMKSHNTTAENKYRDQANDSATVRHWRKMNGTPEWYKKKYGHVKEEIEIDESEYDYKKAMKSDNPRIQKKGIGGAMDAATKRIKQSIKDVPLNSLEKTYKEEVELEEAAGTGGAKVRIHSPGHSLHGMVGQVFHRHDDGRVNVQIRGRTKGDVRNLTLKPNQFKTINESSDICRICGCTPCNCTHIDLQEGKMGQIHADIGEHLDKHIADYKAHGGAEHLGAKTVKAAGHIAKLHGIEQKHAQKFVNDYVESKLKEESEQVNEMDYGHDDGPPWHGHGYPKGADKKGGKEINLGPDKIVSPKKYVKQSMGDLNALFQKAHTEKKVKKEEVEQIDEISQHTLNTAIHKRYQQAVTAKHGSPEHTKALKSMGNMNTVSLKRTQKELLDMAKNNPEAYKKSAQQAADSDRARGWSTEEYEHVSEAWNQPDYSQSIQARQAKADAEKLPFKPDVKKTKPSTPGKYGSGYSTARNLARQALKQQAAKLKPMKESEESRKAAIVKDVAKKAKKKVESDDKFNADPILTSDIQKQ